MDSDAKCNTSRTLVINEKLNFLFQIGIVCRTLRDEDGSAGGNIERAQRVRCCTWRRIQVGLVLPALALSDLHSKGSEQTEPSSDDAPASISLRGRPHDEVLRVLIAPQTPEMALFANSPRSPTTAAVAEIQRPPPVK